ncbi:hypothetical protein BLA60_16960 [Actinophytocola xinjiangensis]|uniref:Secreted protein n=1 Tax=Actinophytocola xinjiangensis TaxID=485602 RepID=A0A7Z0WLC7_9PSEU|nr:hypothetical protein [Actinophytocola xinjiangensis]OLF10138.1 hypothetical protein BLA60_16960 [Actinophytocola xinjiangensis]
MVPVNRRSRSAIFVAHFAIAAVACATTTGVPKPSENTVSSTHEISFPTRSAIRSRTSSRTNATTSPKIIVTVLTDPLTDAAPFSASVNSLDCRRYDSRAAPSHSPIAFSTDLV